MILKRMGEVTGAVMLKHVHLERYKISIDINILGVINNMVNSSMWKCLTIFVLINEFYYGSIVLWSNVFYDAFMKENLHV